MVSKNKDKSIISDDLILYLHGASAFQILHAGFELNIFNYLNDNPMSSSVKLSKDLSLDSNALKSLLRSLSSLNLIKNEHDSYCNSTQISDLFKNGFYDLFNKMILIQAHIMYLGQIDYVDSIKQNKNFGLKRYNGIGETIYSKINSDFKLKKIFYDYMDAYSAYALPYLLSKVDFSLDKKILDVGGGGAHNAISISQKNPNLTITLFDLETAKSTALKNIHDSGLNSVKFYEGDMFKNNFPSGQDSILFFHQLVIWSLEDNYYLLKKSYDSLTVGGRVIIFSSVSNDDSSGPLMAGLDSVYFRSVAAGNGDIYSSKDYTELLEKVGFKNIEVLDCDTWTPHKILVAYKN